jgi:spermidine synthase
VLPLAIYLFTFIGCFARHSVYRRWIFHPLFAMAAMLTLVLGHRPTTWDIVAYLLLLFAVCMVSHGELVLLKPPAAQLTSFYLSLAAGGALGSVFVSVLAPRLFTEIWELPIAQITAAVLVIIILFGDRQSWFYTSPSWMPVLLVWGVVVYNRLMVSLYKASPAWNNYNYFVLAACAVVSLLLLRHRRNVAPYFPWLRPAPFFAIALVGVLTFHAITQVIAFARTSTYRSRNFFGILHVSDNGTTRKLLHGRTSHGEQIIDPKYRDLPTSYYLADSGVGSLLFEERHRHPGALRVGVVGLGAGTLAAYGKLGDYYRFYEINPDVYGLSAGPSPTFTFLKDSPARIDVEIGDARLLLEAEAGRGQLQNFDVLVLDAFNSDSIPVHLLTREAVELYLRHMKRDGVLAFHISNRSLNLAPVIAGIEQAFGLQSAFVQYSSQRYQSSTWVLLSRDRSVLELPLIREKARYGMDTVHDEYWTDDYSNLLRLVMWHK